ncbi:MAG: Short-chain dehydrogenase/reductase SDR [uncultured Truepera sp.]|uniref:Short-chain dehydrogenase/reductase SDR n=1 Tax=uncultured Truepera sp. TaxID=543023 RepID=A0A6J4VJQ2_9DEIN|nr:MAG: Short-chain dehydrogenase/reductase SDR [uncultured Truepera sp.]
MKVKLKKLSEQVMVITGASSGIGLATARLAAKGGARVVLAARNEAALEQLVTELQAQGHKAVYVVADVGHEDDVRKIARVAHERFGGFDTWVNNAATGIFGALLDGATDDYRRLFETNFWGVVYGSLEAARHLSGRGGALINVGSALSDRALPLQGIYATSKHAVKGFTDALRTELEAADAPVSVTLVKPAAIDTPFPQHAKNYMSEEPTLPPPVYAPEVVAEAILHAARTPERDVIVGGGGKLISVMGQHAPRLADKMMATKGFLEQQKSGRPAHDQGGALYRPTFGLQERGEYDGHVKEASFYTRAARQPLPTALLVAAAGLALTALLRGDARKR